MKKLISLFVIAASVAAAFCACTPDNPKDPEIKLEGIKVTPAALPLDMGATATLKVTFIPENVTVEPKVEWTTSDPEVATVDGGTVTAVAAGEATITASAGGFTATCAVTVTGSEPEPDTFDYTPGEEYLAETNLWKAVADADGEGFSGHAMESVTKKQSTYKFEFAEATPDLWANFGFIYTTEGHSLPLKASSKYTIKYTLYATQDMPAAFLKVNKDDPATEAHEDGYIWETTKVLTANTPLVVSDQFDGVDCESIAFTIAFGGNPADVRVYIKDLIIEEIVPPTPSVPEAFAGTYKVTDMLIHGGLYITKIEAFKDKSWMWNSSVYKEQDNILIVDAANATVDYQAGADGAFWDRILIAEKNKFGTGDLDLRANFDQIPHKVSSLSVDASTGAVLIDGTVAAQAYTPGEYPISVDWAGCKGTITVPEGSIALYFKCTPMPQDSYTWDSNWQYTDFDRFVIHPFGYVAIFAKQE